MKEVLENMFNYNIIVKFENKTQFLYFYNLLRKYELKLNFNSFLQVFYNYLNKNEQFYCKIDECFHSYYFEYVELDFL